MAVKFGTNGTLYCNTVKYNYKQGKNLIADWNNAQHSSTTGIWQGSGNVSMGEGYKSGLGFFFSANSSGTNMWTQTMPKPTANHKYYGAMMWKTPGSSFNASDSRFEWYYTDGDTNNMLTFAQKSGVGTSGSWVKLSKIVQAGSNPTSGAWKIRNFTVNNTGYGQCCKLLIVDLTDVFGAGNEPSKEWCDVNILEMEKYSSYDDVSPKVTNANYNTVYTFGALSTTTLYNYLDLQSYTSLPSDYMYYLYGNEANSEGYVYSASTLPLVSDTSTYYYFLADYLPERLNVANTAIQCYWPIAEPHMGGTTLVDATQFNGGGIAKNWKRVGSFATRSSFSSGNYQQRIDFDNQKTKSIIYLTALGLVKLTNTGGVLNMYNYYNGCSITVSYLNKEWCERWIDSRVSPIIRIKDPHNTTIKFGGKGNYVELDYIEATGTQWIQTDLLSSDFSTKKIRCEIGIMPASGSSARAYSTWIGCQQNLQYLLRSDYGKLCTYAGGNINYPITMVDNTRYDMSFTANYNNNVINMVINGTNYTYTGTSWGANTTGIMLFASHAGSSPWTSELGVGRLYYCRFYDGDRLIMDLVPCLNTLDQRVGLYDRVGATFYSNDGTGNFIYGNVKPSTFNDGGNPTDYDVICNDIEIHPEMNSIVMDKTGTIKCRILSRTQNY